MARYSGQDIYFFYKISRSSLGGVRVMGSQPYPTQWVRGPFRRRVATGAWN